METVAMLGFALTVLIGSYVQSVTGFAMGMIVVAIVGGLRIVDIPTLGASLSFLTILNVVLALRGDLQRVHKPLFLWLALGQLPAIFFGLQLMNWLDGNTRWLLELCLGLFIAAGGLSLSVRPQPWRTVSGPWATWLTGLGGGLVGGMFAASGPVLGWFSYSQPLPLAVIRATLLASFLLTNATRTVFVAAEGGITPEVLAIVGLGLPVVLLGTWLGRRHAPPWSDTQIKRGAHMLLIIMGLWTLSTALYRMG